MQKKDTSKPPMDKNERKRGRPAGRNRVPLSLEERRARNAQYERERRNETADAMAQLAEAACCDPQITNPELLATVINRLQQDKQSKSIDELKRINEDLESQIADLQSRLESDPNFNEKELNDLSNGKIKSRSDSNTDTGSDSRRPTKYRKTSKRSKVHDRRSSSSHREPSTDSQDSTWSNHHMGKTLPNQTLPQSPPSPARKEVSSDTSSHLEWTDSISSEYRQANSIQSRLRFEDELYCESECSEKSQALSQNTSQQNVTVDFQLVPELSQIGTENIEEHGIASMDPFTDGEKAILERLGWSDFIDFQGAYSESQSNLMWPVDFAGF